MGLKNYTTSISTERTIMEIEKILATHGASDIWKQYAGDGDVIGVNFIVQRPDGTKIPFRLPMNAQAVSQVLINEKKAGRLKGLPKRKVDDIHHARQVGWRIIKDWIDAQMALIEVEMVKIEQVFLPYAYDYASNQTLYERLEERKFKNLLLESEIKKEV